MLKVYVLKNYKYTLTFSQPQVGKGEWFSKYTIPKLCHSRLRLRLWIVTQLVFPIRVSIRFSVSILVKIRIGLKVRICKIDFGICTFGNWLSSFLHNFIYTDMYVQIKREQGLMRIASVAIFDSCCFDNFYTNFIKAKTCSSRFYSSKYVAAWNALFHKSCKANLINSHQHLVGVNCLFQVLTATLHVRNCLQQTSLFILYNLIWMACI